MEHRFNTPAGLAFIIEASTFRSSPGADADFEKIAADIEQAFSRCDAAKLAQLHAGAQMDDDGEYLDAGAR